MAFERRGGATVAASCRCRLPLQVLAPVELDDPASVVSVLNPTGGLVGGDRLAIDLALGDGAHACLTSPSATRVYRTSGPPAVQDVRVTVGAGATFEWVPEHTIPYPGSAFRQRLDVTLGEGARLIAVDAFAAGRVERGEAWRFARLESALSIRDARGWRCLDRFALDGSGAARWAGAGVTAGHPYFATVLVAADDLRALEAFAAEAGDLLGGRRGVSAAAGALPRGGVIVRVLACAAPALLGALDATWALARRHVLGLPALALRRT
jgi:urease accessory protein